MDSFERIQQTFCRIYGEHLSRCHSQHTWFELIIQNWTPTLVSALTGTIIGGFVTYLVQTMLKKRDAENVLKSRVALNVMKVAMIKADLESLIQAIERELVEHAEDVQAGMKLWQLIYKFDFEPRIRGLDNDDMAEMVKLKSRNLVEKLMALSSLYTGIVRRIELYHKVKDEFEEIVRDKASIRDGKRFIQRADDDPHRTGLEKQMEALLDFLHKEVPSLSELASEVHRLLGEASKRRFGTVEFLKLDA